jgi:hypothetical protein
VQPERAELERCLERYSLTLQSQGVALATKIQLGAEIWRVSERIDPILQPLKEVLREMAKKALNGQPGVTQFEGDSSTLAQVTLPPRGAKVDPELGVDEAKKILGEDFNRVFKVTLTLRPEALTVLENLPKSTQQAVSKHLTLVDATPRVSLKSLPGVEAPKK